MFSTAEGATPGGVLKALNAPPGSKVVAVPRSGAEALVGVRKSLGTTGDAVLDAAHHDLLGVTKSKAKSLVSQCKETVSTSPRS